MMRKLFMVAIAVLILSLPVTVLRAQNDNLKAQKQFLKLRQKEERAALKFRNKNWKHSLRERSLPKAERIIAKHQMAREARQLRQRQKDDRQDFRDRQRQIKEYNKHL
jgi:hypothetical protein